MLRRWWIAPLLTAVLWLTGCGPWSSVDDVVLFDTSEGTVRMTSLDKNDPIVSIELSEAVDKGEFESLWSAEMPAGGQPVLTAQLGLVPAGWRSAGRWPAILDTSKSYVVSAVTTTDRISVQSLTASEVASLVG